MLSSKYTHAGTLYTRDQTVSLAVDQPSTLSAVVEALFVALFHKSLMHLICWLRQENVQ